MKRVMFILFAAVLLALSLHVVNSPSRDIGSVIFSIQYGERARGVAKRLEKERLIRSGTFFLAAYHLFHRSYVKAGSYSIHPDMTTLEILNTVTKGITTIRRITIPEGFTIIQMAERLEAGGVTEPGRFLYYCNNTRFLSSIGIDSSSAEGYLFPDTYNLPERSDPRHVISVLHNRLKDILQSLGADGVASGLSVHQVLTLASLIEKEAKLPDERAVISSVFHNRLAIDMKLDCDPTVRYAVKKFTGPITFRDLESDSPYNTYRRRGLPPTPICSPGKGSIQAALFPNRTKFYFFVAKKDGSHYFSQTLREHLRAVQYFQKGIGKGFANEHDR